MSESLAPRFATYFARYPDPIDLPSAGSHIVDFAGPLIGYDGQKRMVLHYEGGQPSLELTADQFPAHAFVSIRFHRGERRHSVMADDAHELIDVVRRITPDLVSASDERPAAIPGDAFASYVVVEMVTPLVWPEGETFRSVAPSHEVMGPNLTRCIEGLRMLVNAYRLSQGVSIAAPARERLGSFILGSTRPVDPDDGGWDDDGSMVVNTFATSKALPAEKPLDIAQFFPQIASLSLQFAIGHPGIAFAELKADAKVALFQYGDFRSSILLLHTSSEVMLDAVLISLAWEEVVTAEVAATEFSGPLMSRVRNRYHGRLGGDWSTNGNSAVERWRTGLVLRRHAVAHAGWMPDRDDAEDALAAYEAMHTHVWNRLAARISRYPLTVGMFMGRAALERRGPLTRSGQLALEAVSLDTFVAFCEWRDQVGDARKRAGLADS